MVTFQQWTWGLPWSPVPISMHKDITHKYSHNLPWRVAGMNDTVTRVVPGTQDIETYLLDHQPGMLPPPVYNHREVPILIQSWDLLSSLQTSISKDSASCAHTCDSISYTFLSWIFFFVRKIELCFISVQGCVPVWVCGHCVHAGACGGQRRVLGPLGTRATDECKPPCVVAGNQTHLLQV